MSFNYGFSDSSGSEENKERNSEMSTSDTLNLNFINKLNYIYFINIRNYS